MIAPSRFGYLGSTMPVDASGAAQADTFVALLDHLDVDTVDVLGVSAGTSAAVQLALRHPDRVTHLVICRATCRVVPRPTRPRRRSPGRAARRLLVHGLAAVLELERALRLG